VAEFTVPHRAVTSAMWQRFVVSSDRGDSITLRAMVNEHSAQVRIEMPFLTIGPEFSRVSARLVGRDAEPIVKIVRATGGGFVDLTPDYFSLRTKRHNIAQDWA
jgi:hypothetical protein